MPYPLISLVQRLPQTLNGRSPLNFNTRTFEAFTLSFLSDSEATDVFESVKELTVTSMLILFPVIMPLNHKLVQAQSRSYTHSFIDRILLCLVMMDGICILPERSLEEWVWGREPRRGGSLILTKITLWVLPFSFGQNIHAS